MLTTPIHTSELLEKLIDQAPADRVDLNWLLGHLQSRSFGLLLLILAIANVVPGLGIIASILICFPAVEMMLARETPRLPRRLTNQPFAPEHFTRWARRALPILKAIERISRSRWHTPTKATKRVIGLVVLALAISGLLPVPLINIVPALTIALIAIAYLQEDGLLLGISFAIAALSLVLFAYMVCASAGALGHLSEWIGLS